MAKTISLAVVFIALCISPLAAKAETPIPEWLIGSWEMTYDPDGSPKEFIDIYGDGTLDIRGENGGHFQCKYSYEVVTFRVICMVRGQEQSLPLTIIDNNTTLKQESGALYKKLRHEFKYEYKSYGWNSLSLHDGIYTSLSYGPPSHEKQIIENEQNRIEMHIYSFRDENTEYVLTASVFSPEDAAAMDEDKILTFAAKRTVENMGGSLLSLERIQSGVPAYEMHAEAMNNNTTHHVLSRLYWADNILLQFIIAVPVKEYSEKNFNGFISSIVVK